MKEELLKLIKENPNLDVVVMSSTDNFTDEYGSFLMEKINAEIMDIYNSPYDGYIYFDKDDVIDKLRDILCDEEKYKNISYEEYEKVCEEKAKDYFYKKAIVIWASN